MSDYRARAGVDALAELVRRFALTALVALTLAALVAPWAGLSHGRFDDTTRATGSLRVVTGYAFGGEDRSHFGAEGHPNAVGLGLLLLRVGVPLLVLGLLVSAGAALSWVGRPETSTGRIAGMAGVVAGGLGALLVVAGLAALPEAGADAVGPTWGVWAAAVALTWGLLGHLGVPRLDEALAARAD